MDIELFISNRGIPKAYESFAQDLLRRSPDFIVFFFGVHDAIVATPPMTPETFRKRLHGMVAMSWRNNAVPVIITIPRFYDIDTTRACLPNDIIAQYNHCIDDIAKQEHAGIIDFAQVARTSGCENIDRELLPRNADISGHACVAGMHLTSLGHHLLSALLWKCLSGYLEGQRLIAFAGDHVLEEPPGHAHSSAFPALVLNIARKKLRAHN